MHYFTITDNKFKTRVLILIKFELLFYQVAIHNKRSHHPPETMNSWTRLIVFCQGPGALANRVKGINNELGKMSLYFKFEFNIPGRFGVSPHVKSKQLRSKDVGNCFLRT